MEIKPDIIIQQAENGFVVRDFNSYMDCDDGPPQVFMSLNKLKGFLDEYYKQEEVIPNVSGTEDSSKA